ncbi:MAG: hypothetical protein ACRDRT_15010, partial [Pseudonocardiaceae bacterium]
PPPSRRQRPTPPGHVHSDSPLEAVPMENSEVIRVDHNYDFLDEVDPMRLATVKPLEPGITHILKEMTVHEAPSPAPKSRRRRLAPIASIAVASVAIPTAAIAISGGLHTGIFGGCRRRLKTEH